MKVFSQARDPEQIREWLAGFSFNPPLSEEEKQKVIRHASLLPQHRREDALARYAKRRQK